MTSDLHDDARPHVPARLEPPASDRVPRRRGPRRPSALLAALALVALAVAAGCGAGGDGEAAGDRRTMTVIGTEMAFAAPDRVAPGDYVVTFRNDGAVYHELAFKAPSGRFVARRSIAGGESVTMEVSLTAGTWELGCFEPGHYEAGMHRPLVVG